jgi:hypothetical protein
LRDREAIDWARRRGAALSRLGKWLVGIVGTVALVILGVWLWLWFAFRGTPSDIVDFHPAEFQAKATDAFFFSVGDELKYSSEIDPQAGTLSRGHIDNFLVSPSRDKIAVVTGRNTPDCQCRWQRDSPSRDCQLDLQKTETDWAFVLSR